MSDPVPDSGNTRLAQPADHVPDVSKMVAALRFYRDQWTFHAVGDEGDGVTDMGRLDGYEASPTNALLKDGGDLARAAISQGVIRADASGYVEVAQPAGAGEGNTHADTSSLGRSGVALGTATPHLTHADACRLSRAFNQTADLRTDEDRRINDWLKELIAHAAPIPLEDTRLPTGSGA